MKKTFQDELKSSTTPTAENYNNCSYNADHNNDCDSTEDDINFKYMKHVLIKFLTSSDYEVRNQRAQIIRYG